MILSEASHSLGRWCEDRLSLLEPSNSNPAKMLSIHPPHKEATVLIETRGNDSQKPLNVEFSHAILNPDASFGGLYAPEALPILGQEARIRLKDLSYAKLAKEIFALLGIELEEEILHEALSLYDHFDDPAHPAPLVPLKRDLSVLELYHGPTRAFKDMALQPFGRILSRLAQQRGERYLILAATSGDTGPATLESFANQKNIQVVCLYPQGGTSDVQRLQMTTQEAENLKVLGIHGDFDDAQAALKSLLKDDHFRASLTQKGISLSAANSVNFGRIAFQIIYHAYASLRSNSPIDVIVPSGNFGNALGAFYAKLMGFGIGKIMIASNANNILAELITTGIYDIRGKTLKKTQSPAMDILKSSNVERVLFALLGAQRTKTLMENLEKEGFYALNASELEKLQEHFVALFCEDSEGERIIREYAKAGYLMDPHTATGIKAYEDLESDSQTLKVLCSTAEWTKFAPTVAKALGKEGVRDLEALHYVKEALGVEIHPAINSLFAKKEIHTEVIQKEKIKEQILAWLGA